MLQFDSALPSAENVYSVSQLTALIKDRLESDARLVSVSVTGELSNFKHHTSGHMYFTLKDDKSRIRGVMFASRSRLITFRPEDGMRVICTGSISVFDRDGQYQLYVDGMQPDGIGALYVAFLQLRDKLTAEGLFEPDRKRALPRYPKVIGVVTSPTGAVIRDIVSTLTRRFPLAKVVLAPALVQGPGAAQSIVEGLAKLQADSRVEVIIVGRGGGSLEELWPFNEEPVVRAVATSSVPVVSAVGHETDVTLCDFAADMRAATPTAAAELVAPSVDEIRSDLRDAERHLQQSLQMRLLRAKQVLEAQCSRPALSSPRLRVDRLRQQTDYMEELLKNSMRKPMLRAGRQLGTVTERIHAVDLHRRLAGSRQVLERRYADLRETVTKRVYLSGRQFDTTVATLEALNPLSILRRGYSVVYRAAGEELLTSASQAKQGERLRVHLHDGQLAVRVESEGDKSDGTAEQVRLDI